MEYTAQMRRNLTRFLLDHDLAAGLGTEYSPCSVAAINLCMTGGLSDTIPPCMSYQIGKWIIAIQDAMPAEMRNSWGWKSLLPLAAGTGNDREGEILTFLQNWMWDTVFPALTFAYNRMGRRSQWIDFIATRGPFNSLKGDEFISTLPEYLTLAIHSPSANNIANVAANSAYIYLRGSEDGKVESYWDEINPIKCLESVIGVTK